MGRKKQPEEHENLERWLVSYSDFMTLLFATFVVLYALAQSDVNSFKSIEDALRRAFTQNIFDNQSHILDGNESIFTGEHGATNPLMLEYMSQKYEQSSYEEIKKSVEQLKTDGITAEIDERGLVIRLNDRAIKFLPASADLTKDSYEILDKIAKIIKNKFSIHYIQIEGHTDSDPITSDKYPSNWELSGARASGVVRYFIKNHGFNPKVFSAMGLADTAPLAPNTTLSNKQKNRRVEIIILKNKNKNLSKKNMQEIMREIRLQQQANDAVLPPIEATEVMIEDTKKPVKHLIDTTDRYENESERINKNKKYVQDLEKPEFLESYE